MPAPIKLMGIPTGGWALEEVGGGGHLGIKVAHRGISVKYPM